MDWGRGGWRQSRPALKAQGTTRAPWDRVVSLEDNGGDALPSSPPAAGFAAAAFGVSALCGESTHDKGCARCVNLPNITRHGLATGMQHLV